MDKTIEQIFKVFNHLAREIQAYFFSGLVIALNGLLLDYLFFDLSLFGFIKSKELLVPTLIVIYLLGQFSFGFYYLVLETWKGDKKINQKIGINADIDNSALPGIYIKNPELYLFFVERYMTLHLMRGTLCSSCFLNVVTNIFFIVAFGVGCISSSLPKKAVIWQLVVVIILFILGTVVFYLIGAQTEEDCTKRVNLLKEDFPQKPS